MKKVVLATLLCSSIFAGAGEPDHYMQTKGEKIRSKLNLVGGVLLGNFDHRGVTPRSLFANNFKSWNQLGKIIQYKVENDQCLNLSCSTYLADYIHETKGLYGKAKVSLPLFDGPNSFKLREKIIDEANSSILISTWAIYDDTTGYWLRDKLLAKIKENKNLKVKILVDAQVSSRAHHFAVLKELLDKGNGAIEVLYWRTKKYRTNGNHRKFMVVDNNKMIIGGMNFGDVYSHMGGTDLWRDTDIYLEGSISTTAYNLFANIWNEQRGSNRNARHLSKMSLKKVIASSDESIDVVLNDHNPGTKKVKADHNITHSIVKLISEAEKSVEIENAYFILNPTLRYALSKAISRGVQVKILTNSSESVDEEVVSNPIMSSAVETKRMGARVFLKKGSTLHSKFLVVDKKVAMIGSYNMHPRSYRFEGETVATVFNQKTALEVSNQFNRDIEADRADEILDANKTIVPDSFLAKLARTLFFDQL